MTRRMVGILMLTAVACACGDDRNAAQPSVLAPSAQPATPASSAIDGRCALAPPASPRAAVAGTTVTFTWAAVADAREYVVAVGTTPGGSQTLFTATPTTSYAWNAVTGSYYARIHAHSRCGASDPSSELSVVVQGS